ncbi:hypothetical protein BLGI_1430 [Brevibacillus laterosporus GI-9]|uniref:hypothetical protein n=1 Tax=Brevibacillus laterosporus TaxID=1465 RepID=UPI0002404B0C|nr:hypothetical protein [Brevibacillus laterosporus]CCF13514.1 hypothetical protein BLGI_1430 [Brevibacillus laterosporus GI-9]
MKYDSDFELSVATIEELEELSNVEESKSNDDEIIARAIPDEPAKYPLARKSYENLDDLKAKEKAFEQAARYNPSINPSININSLLLCCTGKTERSLGSKKRNRME